MAFRDKGWVARQVENVFDRAEVNPFHLEMTHGETYFILVSPEKTDSKLILIA